MALSIASIKWVHINVCVYLATLEICAKLILMIVLVVLARLEFAWTSQMSLHALVNGALREHCVTSSCYFAPLVRVKMMAVVESQMHPWIGSRVNAHLAGQVPFASLMLMNAPVHHVKSTGPI